MATITTVIGTIDRCTALLGRCLAWLTLAMVLLTCTVVVLRYGLDRGAIVLQEAVVYLHACVFLLGAGYALQRDAHVRVDILYRNFSARARAWVNALGTLVFLLPLCGYVLLYGWPFAASSWAITETSAEPGGIPAVYLLKTLVPAMAVCLGLQGIAELLRSAQLLWRGDASL